MANLGHPSCLILYLLDPNAVGFFLFKLHWYQTKLNIQHTVLQHFAHQKSRSSQFYNHNILVILHVCLHFTNEKHQKSLENHHKHGTILGPYLGRHVSPAAVVQVVDPWLHVFRRCGRCLSNQWHISETPSDFHVSVICCHYWLSSAHELIWTTMCIWYIYICMLLIYIYNTHHTTIYTAHYIQHITQRYK